ncbi:MAG: cation transporter, partial [Pyrinomonadaceae bacterium]
MTGEKNVEEVAATFETAAPARADGGSLRVDLPLTGMTCAACARRIERRLSKASGVESAAVNFATSRATVEYDPERTGLSELTAAVRDIGYGVLDVTAGDARSSLGLEEEARRAEARDLKRRFLVAAALSLPVLVVAMSHGRVPLFKVSWANWLQL